MILQIDDYLILSTLFCCSRRSDGFFIDDRSIGDIGNYDFINGPEAALALSNKLGAGCNSTLPISPDHIRQVSNSKYFYKIILNIFLLSRLSVCMPASMTTRWVNCGHHLCHIYSHSL